MHRGKVDPGVSELPQGNELSRDHVNGPLISLRLDPKPYSIFNIRFMQKIWKVWYSTTLLKLSGPGGIRAHIKTIKIILMENFEGSPRKVQDRPYVVYLFKSLASHTLYCTISNSNHRSFFSFCDSATIDLPFHVSALKSLKHHLYTP